jgi:PEP-CTERM motif
MENPDSGHTPKETPKFSFSILDQTTSSTLYSVAFNSINASSQGITWKTGLRNSGNSSTWMYSDWNIIQIDTSALTGHTLSIDATAYDCALGGHGGYAYIDAFSQNLPVANPGVSTSGGPITAQTFNSIPEPSSYVLFGLGALGLVIAYRRRVA